MMWIIAIKTILIASANSDQYIGIPYTTGTGIKRSK